MRLTTEQRDQAGATVEQMTEALEALDSTREESFVVVERSDGVALQVLPMTLERLEVGRIYRATMTPAVVALFEAFEARREGWDRGIRWVDVTGLTRRTERRGWLVFFGAIVVLAATVGWFVWSAFRGR